MCGVVVKQGAGDTRDNLGIKELLLEIPRDGKSGAFQYGLAPEVPGVG
jgi:hypothetical protein